MRFVLYLWLCGRLLQACTLVEGDRILGANLAAEHPSFAGVDPLADFGPAPVVGARRTLQHFELDGLAKQHSIALAEGASRDVCFERSTFHLEAETLRATLRAALQVPDLQLLDFSRNALPIGRPEFRQEGLSSAGLWRGKWLYGDNRSVPIWARVHSPSGSMNLRVLSGEQKIGRGETVRVGVHSGGVLLAFDAVAESSGHVGEQVTVRNPDNGQRFRAVVLAPGKVEIRK
jgi:hypothetical protein